MLYKVISETTVNDEFYCLQDHLFETRDEAMEYIERRADRRARNSSAKINDRHNALGCWLFTSCEYIAGHSKATWLEIYKIEEMKELSYSEKEYIKDAHGGIMLKSNI